MKRFIICVLSLLVTSGCDSTKKALGLKKVIPDEHTLMERPALTVPDDLYTLHPPKSGDPEVAYRSLRENAGKTGIKETGDTAKLSASERRLLAKVDASKKDPNIRKKLDTPGK